VPVTGFRKGGFPGAVTVNSLSPEQLSRSRLIVMIQEPFRDNVIRRPLKVDGPALPGAQEWNPTSLQGREGVGCSWGGHPLADDNGARPGPVIKHQSIRTLAAVVGRADRTNTSEWQYRPEGMPTDRASNQPERISPAQECSSSLRLLTFAFHNEDDGIRLLRILPNQSPYRCW